MRFRKRAGKRAGGRQVRALAWRCSRVLSCSGDAGHLVKGVAPSAPAVGP
jgi:hypothetical protein